MFFGQLNLLAFKLWQIVPPIKHNPVVVVVRGVYSVEAGWFYMVALEGCQSMRPFLNPCRVSVICGARILKLPCVVGLKLLLVLCERVSIIKGVPRTLWWGHRVSFNLIFIKYNLKSESLPKLCGLFSLASTGRLFHSTQTTNELQQVMLHRWQQSAGSKLHHGI